jgi:hypothetical protein
MLPVNKVIHVTKITLESYHALLDLGYVVVFVSTKEVH